MNSARIRRTASFMMIAFLLLVCCAPTTYYWSLSNAPVNSVRRLAGSYGVSKQEVIHLASELGVDPNRLDEYGPGNFPANYVFTELERIEEQHGVVSRKDVENILAGYELKCELFEGYVVYLYYSKIPSVPIFGRRAMMLEFCYRGDQTLERWNAPDLNDSGHEWEKQTIKEKCLGQSG